MCSSDLYDNHGDLLSLSIIHRQLHAYFGLHSGRKAIDGKFDDRLRISGTIGVIHGDLDGLLLTNGHTHDPIVETFDHHSTADLEFQGRTTF